MTWSQLSWLPVVLLGTLAPHPVLPLYPGRPRTRVGLQLKHRGQPSQAVPTGGPTVAGLPVQSRRSLLVGSEAKERRGGGEGPSRVRKVERDRRR